MPRLGITPGDYLRIQYPAITYHHHHHHFEYHHHTHRRYPLSIIQVSVKITK
jgi:hypothetical protein